MNFKEGGELVSLARESVALFFKNETPKIKKSVEVDGVFVTIESYPSLELRGCIGFVSKVDLRQGVFEAAREAAFHDFRFEPLQESELDNVVFEVSVLSKRVEIKNSDEIKVGVHGLIVEKYGKSGLLLPQVAVEYGWNSKEFLKHCFLKAGIDFKEKARIYSFTADVFREEAPNGKISRVELKKSELND
jgi:AmmeMemoRadiSam system protein A